MSDHPHGLINTRLFVIGLVLIIAWTCYVRWPTTPQTVPSNIVRVVNPLPTLMPTATPPLVVPTVPSAVAPPPIPVYDGGTTVTTNVTINVCVGICR